MNEFAARIGCEGTRRRLAWLALLLIPLLLWPTFDLPLERDEGEYALAAQLWADGGTPYRDTFLQKPPGILLAYRAMLAVSSSPTAIRIGLLACYLLTVALLLVIAQQLLRSTAAALVTVTSFALLVTVPAFQAHAANTEAFMVLAVVLAVWCLLRGRGDARWVSGAGLAFGLACFTKQTAIVHALWLLPLVPSWKERGIFSATAALPYLTALALFGTAGALPEFLDGVLLHNLEYVVDSGAEARWLAMLGVSAAVPVLALAGVTLAAGGLLLNWERWPGLVVGGWLATGLLGMSIGGVFRGHYAIQAFPAMALGFGAAVTMRERLVPVLLIVSAGWIMANGFAYGKTSDTLLYERYGTRYFLAGPIAAKWLRENAHSVYVFGSEPHVYWLAGFRPPTKYVIQNPLMGGYRSSPARQLEAWVAIGQPSHIVLPHPLSAMPMFPDSHRWLLEQMRAMTRAGYDTVAVVPAGAGRVILPADLRGPEGWSGLVIYGRRDAMTKRRSEEAP